MARIRNDPARFKYERKRLRAPNHLRKFGRRLCIVNSSGQSAPEKAPNGEADQLQDATSDAELEARIRKLRRKKEPKLGLEIVDNEYIGVDPYRLTNEELQELGHQRMSPLKAIRKWYLRSRGGSTKDVRKCTLTDDPAWPFRLGKNPWSKTTKAASAFPSSTSDTAGVQDTQAEREASCRENTPQISQNHDTEGPLGTIGADITIEPEKTRELGVGNCTGSDCGESASELTTDILRKMGFEPESALQALRKHCLDCCLNSKSEVRKCTATGCPLWIFRMGKNPWRRKTTRSPDGRTKTLHSIKNDDGEKENER